MNFFVAEIYAELDEAVRGLRAAVVAYNRLVRCPGWSDGMCLEADELRWEIQNYRIEIAELEEELGLVPGSVELPVGPDFTD